MGCAHDKNQIPVENIIKEKSLSLYEDYEEINPYTFNLSLYNLTWKKKPNICVFNKISEEVMQKLVMKNVNTVIEKMTIFASDKIKYSIKQNQILFYIFCSNGVIITRNFQKINYYFSNYIDNIINLCFVDISLIIIREKEYFSLYEIKRQSKYFFDLNMKEIDFTKRNDLINDGKNEQLSDYEDIDEEDETDINEEKYKDIEIKINENHFNGEYMKNEDKDFLGIRESNKKESFSNGNIIVDVNSILNKEKNNKLLKEIKDYGNRGKKKGKSRNNPLSKNSNSYNYNLSSKISPDKTSKSTSKSPTTKREKDIISNDLLTMISNEKNYKSKEKVKKKSSKNSKSKEKSSKNDKYLFKNKKILNKKYEKNIQIHPLSKQISTIFNDTNKENTKLIHNNDSNINYSNKNNILLNKEDNHKKGTPPYEIKDNCLIISTNKLTKEINLEIQKILFNNDNSNNIESSFDHVNFFNDDRKKIRRQRQSLAFENIKIESGNRLSINYVIDKEEKKNNDYIIIYNKNKTPFDKKISLHKINKIYFINCKFNLDSIYFLKELICMLVKYEDLKKIHFSKNDTYFVGWKFLKQLFRENFNIRWINFNNSNLNDNNFEMIISSLLLKRIRYLNFSYNNITNKSMYLLNTFLIKNQTLTILNLSHNSDINKDGIKMILNSLKLHPNIYKLDLSYMQLTGSGEYISSLLYENKCVHILNLKKDKLNSKDMEFISKELVKLESTLLFLDISDNPEVGSEGLKEIGKLIYNNKSLRSIGLDGMNLSINNYLPIFNGIFKNKTIEYYSMSKNEGLPLKGILNFFLKNPQVKKINIIPWDRENEEDNEESKFSEEEIFLLEKFHLKAPNVILEGINFIDN